MKQILLILTLAILIGCAQTAQKADTAATNPALVGAWKSKIQFTSGAFALVNDLEFMYAFNAGGTMTESSNYDALPPVPPAYGVWKQTDANIYELRYEFYANRLPTPTDGLPTGSGWLPAGHGVLTETITMSTDGKSYTSTIRYEAFDKAGNPVEGGGDATSIGVRMGW